MFASVGTSLKLHIWSKDQLKTAAEYKTRGPNYFKNISWCYDNNFLLALQNECYPEILATKSKSNIELVYRIDIPDVTAVQFKNWTKRIVAIGTKVGQILLYDTKTRCVVEYLEPVPHSVRAIEFSGKNEKLAVATDKTLTIYDASESADATKSYNKIQQDVEGIAFVKFHKKIPYFIAVGDKSGQVSFRDLENGTIINKLQKHTSKMTSLVLVEYQKTLFSSGLDRYINVCDYCSEDIILRKHLDRPVTSLDVSPDGMNFVAGFEDGEIAIYDVRKSFKPIISSYVHRDVVSNISYEKCGEPTDPDEKLLPVSSSSSSVHSSDFSDNSNSNCEEENGHVLDDYIKEMLKTIKNQDKVVLELIQSHHEKLMEFLNHEFDMIDKALNKWDIFNVMEGFEDENEGEEKPINSNNSKNENKTKTEKVNKNK